MEINSSIPVKGMNLDSIVSQMGDGIYSLMLNGLTESEDHKYTASNEGATVKSFDISEGYYLIGYVKVNDTRTIVFLTNPDENKSEIGWFDFKLDPNLDYDIEQLTTLEEVRARLEVSYNTYTSLVYSTESNHFKRFSTSTANDYYTNDNTLPSVESTTDYSVICNCLSFNINHPIVTAAYKANVCDDRIYWTDGYNPPRYLIIDDMFGTNPTISNQQRVTANEGTPNCPPTDFLPELDCDKIRIFRLMNQPDIDIVDIQENGSIPVGSVQFSLAYCDKSGNRLTRFFATTNPVYIIDDSYSLPFAAVQGNPFNLISNKSVKLRLSNIDTKYTYYQIGIIENINGSKNIYQLGPYPTDRTDFVYTGNEQQKQRLSFDEFYQQRPVYELADLLTTVGGKLLLAGLSTNDLPNLQRVANNITLNWQTVVVPYMLPEYTYKGGAFAANYKGYMRGEVYPFGIVFEFADGTDSPVYHIPGRQKVHGQDDIIIGNDDAIQNDPCITEDIPKWKIYDTSSVEETYSKYTDLTQGIITNDSLVGTKNLTFTESISETIKIDSNVNTKIEILNDNTTSLNNTDGSTLFFISDQFSIQIKLIKHTSGNDLTGTFIYKNKNTGVLISPGVYDLETTSIQSILDSNYSSYKPEEYSLHGLYAEIKYDTNITAGQNEGSEYIANMLTLICNILQNKIWYSTYSSTPYKTEAFVSSFYQIDYLQTDSIIRILEISWVDNACSNVYINTSNTVINPSMIVSSEQNVRASISNIINDYTLPGTNYITSQAIEQYKIGATSYLYVNSTTSDIQENSTFVTINNTVQQQDVWTGYVTITTTWTFVYSNLNSVNPFVLKKALACSRIPHKRGKFSYWESTENYPCDPNVWGDLAGQPIRHHKFPDTNTLSHFNTLKGISDPDVDPYADLTEDVALIYPIGIKVDHASIVNALKSALQDEIITDKMLSKIKGYKIVRGNRVNDASIVAKGLLYDVWQHDKKLGANFTKKFYYSNYPYNDLRPDPFILSGDGHYDMSNYLNQANYANNNRIKHPNEGLFNDRYVFYSPETMFAKPKIDGYLMLEQEQYGTSYGHYVPVVDHAKYKRLSSAAYEWSFALANSIALISSLEIGTTVKFDMTGYIGTILPDRDRLRDFMKLGIPERSLAYQYTSVGFYDHFTPISATKNGNRRRRIDIINYLRKDIENVGDNYQFNNLDRETSLYLKLNDTLPSTSVKDVSRYRWGDESITAPEKIVQKTIASYYASIKRDLPDQYGLISTVQYCYTGVKYVIDQIAIQGAIYNTDGTFNEDITDASLIIHATGQEEDTIYGGDIYISRFAFKRKHNYFTSNRRGFPNDTDVNYSDIPNVGYPTFFFDTMTRLLSDDSGETSLSNVKNFHSYAADAVNAQSTDPGSNSNTSGIRNTFRKISLSLQNIYKNLQNRPNDFFEYKNIVDKSLGKLGSFGQIYLHSYGIPYFFVESIINTDLRHRGTNSWEDFYPHTEPDIPDTWLQEDIQKDEYFGYNRDYSAQNTDNPFLPLSLTYDPTKFCYSYLPNRAIYSQPANFEEKVDDYLLFRVNDYADFDKHYGSLKNIVSLPGEKTLVQFTNGSKLFSSFSTLEPSNSTKPIYLGSGTLFQQGVALSDSELGYAGNQHRSFILTEMGAIWVDVKRGAVFSFGGGLDEISLNNKNWFKSNLPFFILKDFPDCNVQNTYHHLNPIGITLSYDNKFNRVIITKHDYSLREGVLGISYDPATHSFKDNYNNTILVTDTDYFVNKSFTISYSFLNKEWISFHSYIPNSFIPYNQYFISVKTNGNGNQSLWVHNQTNKAYQIVYGTLEPYILEFPYYNKGVTNILGSIMMYSETLKYTGKFDYSQNLAEFFNKAVIWNKYQTTGLLKLNWDDPNKDYLAIDYPHYNSDSIDILYSSKDDSYTFNHIWNVVSPNTSVWIESLDSPIIKTINATTNDYKKPQDEMDRMRGKSSFVRMIQDDKWRYKFKVYLQLEKNNPSIY